MSKLLGGERRGHNQTIAAVIVLVGIVGCDGSAEHSNDTVDLREHAKAALIELFEHPKEVCDATSARQLMDSFGGKTPSEALMRCRRFQHRRRPTADVEILSSRVLGADRVELDVAVMGTRGTQFTMWLSGGRWIIERIQ